MHQRRMGEVYRARDTKLDRDVALKVLPHEEDLSELDQSDRDAPCLDLMTCGTRCTGGRPTESRWPHQIC